MKMIKVAVVTLMSSTLKYILILLKILEMIQKLMKYFVWEIKTMKITVETHLPQ